MTSDDTKNAAKDTVERVEAAAEEGKSTAGNAANKTAETARDYAAKAKNVAHDLYDDLHEKVRDTAEGFPDAASDAVAAGRRAYGRSSDTVGRTISKQPIEALLLAGAIGYLVGWAANRG